MALKELNELIKQGVNIGAYPGATYVLVFDDIKYFNYVGNKALIPNVEENELDTIYDIASLSKVVCTTTLILKLMEMGKLRLFDKVVDFLPDFKYEDICIIHLVTHTSGLKPSLSNPTSIKSIDEAVKLVYSAECIFEAGCDIVYSDLNYILLGFIIEKITGISLDEYAKEVLFKPLDMHNTQYNPVNINKCAPTEERSDDVVRGIVRGVVHDETSYIMGGVTGHAGVFSTVHDLSNFIEMVLHNGIYKGNKILSKRTIDLLFTKMASKNIGVFTKSINRSIGWQIDEYNGSCGDFTSSETISHTGFTGTNIFIDRINKVGFCMLTNRVHPTRKNILHLKYRSKIANFIMSNLEELKEEIKNGN